MLDEYYYKTLCVVGLLIEDLVSELVLNPSCIPIVKDEWYSEEDINHFNLCKSIDEAENAIYSSDQDLDPSIFPDDYFSN